MSIGELGCPSLDYVYDMTWAEYLIRLYSFNRQTKQRLFEVREMAYASIVGSHQDPKKIPSKEKFWSLNPKKTNVTDVMKDAIKEARNKYIKEKNNNGR